MTLRKNRALAPVTLALIAAVTVRFASAADTPNAQAPAKQSQNTVPASFWPGIGKLPDFWQGTWMSMNPIAEDYRDPPQYTPWARDYVATYKPKEDTSFTNCKPIGMPFVMNIGGMPMKFFQSPEMISLYIESSGVVRFIHTQQKQHSDPPNPTYLGESIAHWEGDTLVVDTTGFVPEITLQIGVKPKSKSAPAADDAFASPIDNAVFGPHGPNLRLVERMRLKDANTLEIQTTIHDETIFTTPYRLPPRYWQRGTEPRNLPQEWICSDNRDFFDEQSGKVEYNVKDKAQSR